MATYIFKCRECPNTEIVTQSISDSAPSPALCTHGPMVRDYRAEAAGLSGIRALRAEREPDFNPYDFLPDKAHFEKRYGKDAEKEMKKWNEEHEPRGHNSGKYRPGYGENK